MRRSCHKMLRTVAVEMAHEVYDDLMKDNSRYKHWKALCPDLSPEVCERLFVKQMWPHMVEQARATLTNMLTTNIAETLKDQIAEALIRDNSLRHHGKGLH